MSTVKQHIAKAKYNEDFFQSVKYDYPDWALTGLFYSALHLVDAILVKHGITVEDHKTRHWQFSTISALKPLYSDYRALYDYSVNARYKMRLFTIDALNQIYKDFYINIKNHLNKHLKS